jgi:hypothetical protein
MLWGYILRMPRFYASSDLSFEITRVRINPRKRTQ